jgi:biotin carboxyl carrier protein
MYGCHVYIHMTSLNLSELTLSCDRVLTPYYIEPGDFVQADEVVAVIETDKVNVDIRSTHSGVI